MLGNKAKHVCGYGYGGDNRLTDPNMKHPVSIEPPPGVTPPILPRGLEFVTRQEWDAYYPYDYEPLSLPISHIRLTHTGGKSCTNRKTCYFRVKKTQWDSMYHCGLQDVAFNFLIDPDGRVYQGRGWLAQPEREDYKLTGELADKYKVDKEKCIDIAFVGRFNNEASATEYTLPERFRKSAKRFIRYSVKAGYVAPSCRVAKIRPPPRKEGGKKTGEKGKEEKEEKNTVTEKCKARYEFEGELLNAAIFFFKKDKSKK